MTTQELKAAFEAAYNKAAEAVYFSPGRVNLIGEHTDYNGGAVFPCALSFGAYLAMAKNDEGKMNFKSLNQPEIVSLSFDQLTTRLEQSWVNYPLGVIAQFVKRGVAINQGYDILIWGDVPNGAGLSSSAALEVVTAFAFNDQLATGFNRTELAQIGQKAEHEFALVNCGIMDQFAIGMGKKDHALLLDTNTLEYEVVPAEFGEYVVAIMNTNKRRELADSKYNERRSECEEALRRLQSELAIDALGALDEETFFANTALIEDEILIKRAKHAVTENQRTLKAKKALQAGDLAAFGQLLNASHLSLKEDYEVTGIELDTLVAAAQAHPSVLGARMTGAGFGGCAIALVKASDWDDFVATVSKEYVEKIGYETAIYQASIGDGAKKL